jgi:hypothetical protein
LIAKGAEFFAQCDYPTAYWVLYLQPELLAMKYAYKFSNLCGTLYKAGNVVFTPDGNCLLSPVGNRVTVFDLVG